jgi:hypothetical protein
MAETLKWAQPTALHLSVCVLANLERLAVRLLGREFLKSMKLDKRISGSLEQPDLTPDRMNLVFRVKTFIEVGV